MNSQIQRCIVAELDALQAEVGCPEGACCSETGRTIQINCMRKCIQIACLLLLFAQGCCHSRNPSAKWKTVPERIVISSPNREGRVVSAIFEGLESSAPKESKVRLLAEGAVCIGEMDAGTTNAIIDIRGGINLSEGAKGNYKVQWNGRLLNEGAIPLEITPDGTNASWFVRTRFSPSLIREISSNRIQVMVELQKGKDPELDYISIESLDFLWATWGDQTQTNAPGR